MARKKSLVVFLLLVLLASSVLAVSFKTFKVKTKNFGSSPYMRLCSGSVNINESNRITLNGIAKYDKLGWALATGILNADTFNDLVIGSPTRFTDLLGQSSLIYDVYALNISEHNIDTVADYFLNGSFNQESSGRSLAIGDLNNDVLNDLAVGSPQAGNIFLDGEVLIVFGPTRNNGMNNIRDVANIIFRGPSGKREQVGSGIAIGDLNNDGINDIIIGGPDADTNGNTNNGRIYVLYGPFTGLNQTVYDIFSDADVLIDGVKNFDRIGEALAVGDLNSDGLNDLVVGVKNADQPSKPEAGETHIIYGPITPGNYSLSGNLIFEGEKASDYSGSSVATGFFNNDTFIDLIVGAVGFDSNGQDKNGRTYVINGPLLANATGLRIGIDVASLMYFNGMKSGDVSGSAVSLNDLTNDGITDLVIGAYGADPNGELSGQAYVLINPCN